MLLWRQPTGECYVAITADGAAVEAGHTATCTVLGVKSRFEDEVLLEYEMLRVPVGSHLRGCVVDYLCDVRQRVTAGAAAAAAAVDRELPAELPLLNEQASMEDREVISEPLFTGVKVPSSPLLHRFLLTHMHINGSPISRR